MSPRSFAYLDALLMKEREDDAGPKGCFDKIPTCANFAQQYDACSPASDYFPYMEPNCQATCGLCSFDSGKHHDGLTCGKFQA